MSTIPISFRISAEKAKQLDRLAEATERPKSWLLEKALDEYLSLNIWQIDHIAQGLRELDEKQGVLHEEVSDWLHDWGKAKSRKRPK